MGVRVQNDYILRLIEQLGALVRQALERLGSKDGGERIDVAGEAIGLALDIDSRTASELSPQSLTSLLQLGSLDDRVLTLVERAIEIEAAALEDRGDTAGAEFRHRQADAVRALLAPHMTSQA